MVTLESELYSGCRCEVHENKGNVVNNSSSLKLEPGMGPSVYACARAFTVRIVLIEISLHTNFNFIFNFILFYLFVYLFSFFRRYFPKRRRK